MTTPGEGLAVRQFAERLIAAFESNAQAMYEAYERTDTSSDLADSLLWRRLASTVRHALAEFERRS